MPTIYYIEYKNSLVLMQDSIRLELYKTSKLMKQFKEMQNKNKFNFKKLLDF